MLRIIILLALWTVNMVCENNLRLERLNKRLEACSLLLKNPKEINKCKQRVLKLIAKNLKKRAEQKKEQNQKYSSKKPNESKDNKDNENDTAQMLTIFASIVSSMGKIIVNPYDPVNLGTSLCAMIAGIINLATQITRNNNLNDQDIELLFKDLNQEQKEKLTQIYSKFYQAASKVCSDPT